MSALLDQLDQCELELECSFAAEERSRGPRELTGREKQNYRARFSRRAAPKLRAHGGAHQRRNKRYFL